MVTATERGFLLRWTLASVMGWGGGIVLGAALLGAGVLLRVWLPGWVLVPLLPLAGALAGGAVGAAQRVVLGTPPAADRAWVVVSALGGAAGALPGGLVAAQVGGADPLLAQVVAGLAVAGGVGFAQAWRAVPAGGGRWRAAYRWALVNGLAGLACAVVAPAGVRFWLPLTCVAGTAGLGLVTGAALVWVRRI